MNTPNGKEFLKRNNGSYNPLYPDRIATKDSEFLESKEGKEWLNTLAGWCWLESCDGKSWLSNFRQNTALSWLFSTNGQAWIVSGGGNHWLNTKQGNQFLKYCYYSCVNVNNSLFNPFKLDTRRSSPCS